MEDNIKIDLREVDFQGMDWIHLVQAGISGELL
jgi:hypothetical protein